MRSENLTNLLRNINFEENFNATFQNELIEGKDIAGITLFKKHTFKLHEYIQSYQFTKREFQEFWLCLKINIKKDAIHNVLVLINNTLRDKNLEEIPISYFHNSSNQNTITKHIYLYRNYRLDIFFTQSSLSIEIIKFQ